MDTNLEELIEGWRAWFKLSIELGLKSNFDDNWGRNIGYISTATFAQIDTIGILANSGKVFLCSPIVRILYEHIQIMYLLAMSNPGSDIHKEFCSMTNKDQMLKFYYKYIGGKNKFDKFVKAEYRKHSKLGSDLPSSEISKSNLGIFIHPSQQGSILMFQGYNYLDTINNSDTKSYEGIFKEQFDSIGTPIHSAMLTLKAIFGQLGIYANHIIDRYNKMDNTDNSDTLVLMNKIHPTLIEITYTFVECGWKKPQM